MSGHKPSATKAVERDLRIEINKPPYLVNGGQEFPGQIENPDFLRDVRVVVTKTMVMKAGNGAMYFSVLCKPLWAKFLVSFFKLLALWVLPDFVLQHQTLINSFNWTCVSMPPFNLRLESEETP